MAKRSSPTFSPSPLTPDASKLISQVQACFSDIQDPRVQRTRLHQLSDIFVIAFLSVIAGGNGWEDMETYGLNKHYWLSTFLALPNGIPSADTFRRVFERIRPNQLELCFERWVKWLTQTLDVQVVSIDGKTLRGSYDRANQCGALHLVSAWAHDHRLVLAQTKVTDKSNEITAIPALLELLELEGAIVTIDAMGSQKSIATQIIEANADYILCLKSNHPTLFQQVQDWFDSARKSESLPVPFGDTTEAGHYRVERRKVWQIDLNQLPPLHQAEQWQGLQSIVIVERTRNLWNKTTHEIQFYLTSLDAQDSRIAAAIREHWGIENSLHWTLDVTFSEDSCRVRSLHGPNNLAILRRLALNCLNRESSFKRSTKQKSKRAAMNDAYMLSVLASALPDSVPALEPCCQ